MLAAGIGQRTYRIEVVEVISDLQWYIDNAEMWNSNKLVCFVGMIKL